MVGSSPTGVVRDRDDPFATAPGGGDPIYLAPNSAGFSGVVALQIISVQGSRYTCSGTLVGNRSVVTAAHCVAFGKFGPGLAKTRVYFQDDAASVRDQGIFGNYEDELPTGVTAIDVSNYAVHDAWNFQALDQNDIAVVTLAQDAPAYAQRYEIYDGDIQGKRFTTTGYGYRSAVGGTEGYDWDVWPGFRRQGENVFDFALGDPQFNGAFTDPTSRYYLGPMDRAQYSYLADFDDGTQRNNASCNLAQMTGLSAAAAGQAGLCDLGVGPLEANAAPGDSGSGAFIDGKLAATVAYGAAFDTSLPDFTEPDPYGRFGEFSGYVPIFLHADFIRNAIASAVPEPATWAQMLLGFAMIGVATRRRSRRASALA